MKKILMLQPLKIYKRWPLPEDFTDLLVNSPTLAFAQLKACLKDKYEIRYLDGLAGDFALADLSREAAWADAVLINAHSSIGSLNAEANLRHILETCSGKPVIIGGHHATVYDYEWLGRGARFVVRNEGEETIVELLETLFGGGSYEKVKGISWRDNRHEYHRNPPRDYIKNLDDLPLPDWSIYDRKAYSLPLPVKGWATTAETSRGCSFSCSFCAASEMWGHRQRFKSAERVLEELRILNKMGYTKIWFADDNFGADAPRQEKIYEGMLRENLKFNFLVFMRSDTAVRSPNAIKLAYRAGMRVVLLGIETPVKRILDDFSKKSDYETIVESVRIFREAGIFVAGFFIVGYLGEREDETEAVFESASELPDYPVISIFEPRLGTRDFSRAREMNDLPSDDMFYHNTIRFVPSKTHILARYRGFYGKYLIHPRQVVKKALLGTPTQRIAYRTLYKNMARSIFKGKPNMIFHPWSMVRDIYR